MLGVTQPTQLRVAFARSADYTTVWSSVRIDDPAGPFAIVVPLPDGAFVDQSSDAWFEALEVATAPRVFPPEGLSPFCPGQSGSPNPFEIAADTAHQASLPPDSFTLAADAFAVSTWASEQGFSLSADLQGALDAVPAAKFLCVRFTAPGGPALTPTLRVTAKGGLPALPFSITRAGSANVRVDAWFLGDGRGSFDSTATVNVPASSVIWSAKKQTSTYAESRDALLAGQADAVTLESAGHDVLADATPIANGTATIDALAPTYFARASEYGNGSADHASCAAAAKATLASAKAVGLACPRADLAALAGNCTPEAPGPGEVDPATLLCGPGADDLAVALSGAVPGDTFLTFAAGASKQPIVEAGSVDVSDCSGGSGGAGGSTTGGSGNGSGASGSGGAPSGSGNNGSYVGVDLDIEGPTIVAGGCSCNGPGDSGTLDTSETGGTNETETGETETEESKSSGGDDCSGDSSSGSGSGSSGGDDCSGDSSSSSSSGDDCSGDSSSSGSSDGCSCDPGSSSSDGCSCDPGGSSTECAVTTGRPTARRTAGVRLSALTFAMAFVLLPLRRRGTRKRRAS